jgi:enoyl-CoA hydratase
MVDYSHYRYILVEKKDGICKLTMNRPEALNAVGPELHPELERIFADVARDSEVRVVVLTGAGKAFSAGGDIKLMERGLDAPVADKTVGLFGEARRLIHNIIDVPQPIIAMVNGHAMGLGATLALFCDLVYVAEGARIGDPHVGVGLVAGDGGAVIWPLLIGIAKAKEYLLTGAPLGAKEAEQIGLINKAVPLEELESTAMAMAQRLAAGAPKAIQWTKLSINRHLRQAVTLVLDTSLAVEGLSLGTQDHAAAVRAFLQKQMPQFEGR